MMNEVLAIYGNKKEISVLESIIHDSAFHDFRFIETKSGTEGINLAIEHNPDVILLEISEPEERSLEVCRRLKKNPATREIPVIFVASHALSIKLGNQLIESCGNALLKEPFNNIELKVHLKAMQQLKRANEQRMAEKKRAENALLESERLFRTLAENANSGIIMIADKYICTYANPAMCQILGRNKNEIIGHDFREFMNDQGKELPQNSFKNRQGIKKFPKRYTIFLVRKNGEKRLVEISSAIYKTNGGERLQIGQVIDITKQKHAEDRFRIIFQKAPDAYYLMDGEGIFIDGNDAAEKFSGYKRTELIGSNFFELNLVDEPQRLKATKNIAKILKGTPTGPDEFTLIKKDGSKTIVEVTAHPVQVEGKVLVLGLARNITQRKKYELELIRSKEKAQESDRLKSAFLANISHEIRTPMNGILGFMELMGNPNLSPSEHQQNFNMVKKSSKRLMSTIDDIMEISKIESGQISLEKITFNLNDSLTYWRHFFARQAEEKKLELLLSVGTTRDLKIYTDINKFGSILSCLMDNALKFTHHGFVEMGYILDDNQPVFFVKDSGMGIPTERHEAVFERFVQADLEITRPHEGSGLGLSIAKAYTEALGGKIWLESKPGEGSTFYFTLDPEAVQNRPESAQTKRKKNNSVNLNEKTILVAEDDDISFKYMEALFALKKCRIIRAVNGREAVRAVKNNPEIDLVLMDLKMPFMGGEVAASKIRNFNKKIPIIAQTAHVFPEHKIKALNAGCNDYISKPVNKDELFAKIQNCLSN